LATSTGNLISDQADKEWFHKDLSTIIIQDSPED